MIWFDVDSKGVTLEYEPDFGGDAWVTRELDEKGEVTLSRVFTFQRGDLTVKGEDVATAPDGADDDDDIFADEDEGTVYRFRFATTKGGYHHIPGRVLGIDKDVLIVAEGLKLERKVFIAERNIGIFGRIAKLVKSSGPIIVGGDKKGSIPLDAFRELLERFPNSIEVDRYAAARVATILGEFFEGMTSARENYERYLDRRNAGASVRALRQDELLRAEIDKFVFLRDTLSVWLAKATSYSEKEWQKMVIGVILLLFPKYVAVLENVRIADFYSTPGKRKNRFIDLCVVDANGNIDVIEIKKPFDDVLLSRGLYRGNSVPTKELSGTIMQAEKYLFHLSKWGIDGERDLTSRYGATLPDGLQIRVTNPKALLLVGRDRRADGKAALTDSQSFDLEVIKRKYANMMDIVTYDDLLRRLDRIIASLAARVGRKKT
ncbi:MAG: DUF4263 domain-containing protein [Devosia sp.]|uniref:Shedu immune nuclease family protein n=1 Tax=Devosia sp. TaxID=1871048 RepID=UPI001A4C40E7|nr:Shedu immune nuclease family protein [Devosia sp.]MBL8598965.1 DUF4263 domain-containing protein [Devosia sp.]